MHSEQKISFKSASLIDGGMGLRFKMPMYGDYASGFVIRFKGKAYAYVNQCAHVPVELDWKEGEFYTPTKDYLICATHGAHYEPDTGLCALGPCKGKSLKPMVLAEENGEIMVDLASAAQYFSA